MRVFQLGLLSLFASLGLASASVSARSLSPQPGPGAYTFDGWGTSLCWFANAVGRWSEPSRSEIADALFADKGLGLTVVRYNIGGGEQPGHAHMPWFRQMEGFQAADGTWNWTADPGQRWMLEAARRRGAQRFEAFSNSPPWWMTRSGCASGAAKGDEDNLAPGKEEAFARYLAGVVKHFRDEWGLRFDTLDPMNEPWTDYWRAGHNQEGCHFDHASQRRLLQTLRRVLDQEGLRELRLSASDETSFTKAIESWQAYDEPTRACVGQINVHAYNTERRAELHALLERSGKPWVMSEVDEAGAKTHDHDSMEPGLALAKNIIDDLRELRPLRWVFWQAVEDEASMKGCNGNWGLIHADLEGRTQAWCLTKKYHVLAQFSRFIRPGARILSGPAEDSLCAVEAGGRRLVVVLRNAAKTEESAEIDLSAFALGTGPCEAYRSAVGEDLRRQPAPRLDGKRLRVQLAAESVTTLVIPLGG